MKRLPSVRLLQFWWCFYSHGRRLLHHRDDLDTVGIKAGCTVHLWTRLHFAGAYTIITAGYHDRLGLGVNRWITMSGHFLNRWVVLREDKSFSRFHENVESVACSCGPAQREPNILEILKNWWWGKNQCLNSYSTLFWINNSVAYYSFGAGQQNVWPEIHVADGIRNIWINQILVLLIKRW